MNADVNSVHGEGLPAPKLISAMTALSIAMGLAVLDSIIAQVALPSISVALSVTADEAMWIANAYVLAMVVSLLPFASLGDSRGYRRVYLFGLIAFALASLACGLANSLPVLVCARIAQGLGASAIASVNMALVRYIYPPSQLGRGMGLMGLVVAVAAAAGPSVASAILVCLDWHWLFLTNVPLAVIAFALASNTLPSTPASGVKFDYLSTLYGAAGICVLFYTATRNSGNSLILIFGLGAAFVLLAAFLKRQMSQSAPMLPIDLFRLSDFCSASLTSVFAYTCQTITVLTLPFYFHDVSGFSQTQLGLLMTVFPVALIFSAPWAGKLSDRHSAGLLSTVGLAILIAGTICVAFLPATFSIPAMVSSLFACGIGFGLFQSPNNRAFMTSAPRHRSGACAGIMTTSRLTGQAVGGLVVTLAFAVAARHGLGTASAALWAFLSAIGFASIAVATSATRLAR